MTGGVGDRIEAEGVDADRFGFEPQGWIAQAAAVAAALAGAALPTWTEKRWPDIQEALIGVLCVLAATSEA